MNSIWNIIITILYYTKNKSNKYQKSILKMVNFFDRLPEITCALHKHRKQSKAKVCPKSTWESENWTFASESIGPIGIFNEKWETCYFIVVNLAEVWESELLKQW